MVESIGKAAMPHVGWGTVRTEATERSAPSVPAKRPVEVNQIPTRTSQSAPSSAHSELSSFVLQGFLAAALPKNLVGTEGAGTAGEMWRSLLVQELSKTLVASGQIDLLQQATLTPTASPSAHQAEASRNSDSNSDSIAAANSVNAQIGKWKVSEK